MKIFVAVLLYMCFIIPNAYSTIYTFSNDTCKCKSATEKNQVIDYPPVVLVKKFTKQKITICAAEAEDKSLHQYIDYIQIQDCNKNLLISDFWEGDSYQLINKKDTVILKFYDFLIPSKSGLNLNNGLIFQIKYFETRGKLKILRILSSEFRPYNKSQLKLLKAKYSSFKMPQLELSPEHDLDSLGNFHNQLIVGYLNGDVEAGNRLLHFEKYYGFQPGAYAEILGYAQMTFKKIEKIRK
jgi:hypothetical protein